MPYQNRVTPFSEIITTSARGMFMGNRGCLHDDTTTIKRNHKGKRWIICLLEFNGRKRAIMQPHKYTELFFLDEATALSAGHRPCAECQRERFKTFKAHWVQAHNVDAKSLRVDAIDSTLHKQRLASSKPQANLDELPNGAFITLNSDTMPYMIWDDYLFPWQPEGYGDPIARPIQPNVTLLTPPAIVAVLANGFAPIVHQTLSL